MCEGKNYNFLVVQFKLWVYLLFLLKNGMFEVPKTKTATANKKFVEEKKDTLVMLLLSLKSTMHWIQKRVLLLHEAYKEKEI